MRLPCGAWRYIQFSIRIASFKAVVMPDDFSQVRGTARKAVGCTSRGLSGPFRAFGEIHHRPSASAEVIAAGPFGDLAQRQEHEPFLGVRRRDNRRRGGSGASRRGWNASRPSADPWCRALNAIARSSARRLPAISPQRFVVLRVGARAPDSAIESTIGSVKPARPSMSNTTTFCKSRATRAARQDLVELLFIFGEDHFCLRNR